MSVCAGGTPTRSALTSDEPQKKKITMASPYSHRWRKARARFLQDNPLCRLCAEIGRATPATVVDHVEPHRGDAARFWSASNWQALCKTCHDAIKQTAERSGHLRGSNAQGLPLDPKHHWNRS